MLDQKNAEARLLAILCGGFCGGVAGLFFASWLGVPFAWWPILAMFFFVACAIGFGRFQILLTIIAWFWSFPFGFEDQFFGKNKVE